MSAPPTFITSIHSAQLPYPALTTIQTNKRLTKSLATILALELITCGPINLMMFHFVSISYCDRYDHPQLVINMLMEKLYGGGVV